MSWMAAKTLEQEQQLTFNGKERKDKHVQRSLAHKIKERSDWKRFPMHLLCLPNYNYGNGSVSWMVSVSYTADFFEPYLSKYSVLEATKQIFLQRNDSFIHPYQKLKNKITMANYFSLYLRLISSTLCLVSSWKVTYVDTHIHTYIGTVNSLYITLVFGAHSGSPQIMYCIHTDDLTCGWHKSSMTVFNFISPCMHACTILQENIQCSKIISRNILYFDFVILICDLLLYYHVWAIPT